MYMLLREELGQVIVQASAKNKTILWIHTILTHITCKLKFVSFHGMSENVIKLLFEGSICPRVP